jgi:hypothetical protein
MTTQNNDWSRVSEAMMAILDGKPFEPDDGAIAEPVSVKFHEIIQHADTKILEKLSALGDELHQMQWRVGWLTDALYKNLIANHYPVDYLFVCYFVSVVSLKGNRSMNTVKKWALIARFFPVKVAKQYNYDVLPMSHFEYAASFNDLCEPQTGTLVWQAVLDYAWHEYTNSPVSRCPSVNDLKVKFEEARKKAQRKTPVTSGFVPPVASALALDASIPMSGEVASATMDVVTGIIKGIIDNFTLTIGNYLPRLMDSKPKVGQALAGVLHNLNEVSRHLTEEA